MVRYRELHEALADEIAAGIHPVGEKFPTEFALCERFRVSRHTVREALRLLQAQGLLERHAGSGTVVRARAPAPYYTQRAETLAELFDYASDTRFEKRHEGLIHARAGLATLLGCEEGDRWLRLAGIRRLVGSGVAVCWTEIFIAERYASIRESHGDGPYYDRLCRRFGLEIAEVEQKISAAAMTTELGPLLGAAPGSPALETRRRYFTPRGEPFEITLSLHPGDRYAVTQRLRRDDSAASQAAA
jgi:DNA-binding GntR family transcriptional regulator